MLSVIDPLIVAIPLLFVFAPFCYANDCEASCAQYSRPVIEVDSQDFRSLISSCITTTNGDCPFHDVPLNCWNTSKVTDMGSAFDGATDFNERLDCWDVSQVRTMESMFNEADVFNQTINEWDVSRVQTLLGMFRRAYAFNQPINEWNVSRVTNMDGIFDHAYAFNQPIGNWDVSKNTNMHMMFWFASGFNQALDEWDISRVVTMHWMFDDAAAFNQCLATWPSKISTSDVSLTKMFYGSGCAVGYKDGTPSLSASTWCQDSTHGCISPAAAKPFGTHKVARARVQNKIAEVVTLEPFSTKTYFEAKDLSNVVMELYVNVPSGKPCAHGTALNTNLYDANSTRIETTDSNTTICKRPTVAVVVCVVGDSWSIFQSLVCVLIHSFSHEPISCFVANCIATESITVFCIFLVVNTDAAEYVIPNVKSTAAYTAETNNTGRIAICARAAKRLDFDTSIPGAEYVSVVDTVLSVEVDFQAKFQNFTEMIVSIVQQEEGIYKASITKTVDVDAFLCAPGRPADPTYTMGDEFGVCVRPTQQYIDEGYSVTGIVGVVCANKNETRTLFEDSVPDALTKIFDASTVGRDTNGTAAGSRSAGFVSVVTAGYFKEGESSFSCSGYVSVSNSNSNSNSASGRRLSRRFAISGNHDHDHDHDHDGKRLLQEGSTSTSASTSTARPFSSTIPIVPETKNDVRSSADGSSLVGVGVGVGVGGVTAALLLSVFVP